MKEGRELGWLRLTDKCDLVLTSLHILQHQDRGMFGESHAIIPRKVITVAYSDPNRYPFRWQNELAYERWSFLWPSHGSSWPR
jgi:hypothetical protein